DFWQMVWEQGSVVMVMLTRLTENGTAMCHRYWPEEGSELYHIYEVRNLVSLLSTAAPKFFFKNAMLFFRYIS
ncbi:hypothetical protein NL449_29345, partial [Klebsiella pneumoniae]|nr:hypothetical protein [Klebsiella pneumoniae]